MNVFCVGAAITGRSRMAEEKAKVIKNPSSVTARDPFEDGKPGGFGKMPEWHSKLKRFATIYLRQYGEMLVPSKTSLSCRINQQL